MHHNTTFLYYLVDCKNGSDSNDGIKAPFKTLDRVFEKDQSADLRIRLIAPGEYPTKAQHFTSMSLHLVKDDSVQGDAVVSFCGKYPSSRIQFYNCYTHFIGIKLKWDPANRLYFESGYCAMDSGTEFLSDEIRFNGMSVFAEDTSFYRLIVRECPLVKLHNITITKPGANTQDAIHSRDSFPTIYGSLTLKSKMVSNNTASVIIMDRGRLYISTAPTEQTGYTYGIKGNKAEIHADPMYLTRFEKFTKSGNSINPSTHYPLIQMQKEIDELQDEISKLKNTIKVLEK